MLLDLKTKSATTLPWRLIFKSRNQMGWACGLNKHRFENHFDFSRWAGPGLWMRNGGGIPCKIFHNVDVLIAEAIRITPERVRVGVVRSSIDESTSSVSLSRIQSSNLKKSGNFYDLKIWRKMWHEARRSERKVHDMMDAARKRAQRRAIYLAKRRGDPQQSIQAIGSRCRVHRDDALYQATEDQQGLYEFSLKFLIAAFSFYTFLFFKFS